MDKAFYKKCIQQEVYGNQKLNPVSKLLKKHFGATTNCVYMIRKMMYLYGRGKIGRLRSLLIRKKLMTKYSVHVYPTAEIGLGLYIPHPCSIVINGRSKIGENFVILQNCTIGTKYPNDPYGPAATIGNNVSMYANSIIIGEITVADNVTLGANSMLNKDALVPGAYFGSPAKLFVSKKSTD